MKITVYVGGGVSFSAGEQACVLTVNGEWFAMRIRGLCHTESVTGLPVISRLVSDHSIEDLSGHIVMFEGLGENYVFLVDGPVMSSRDSMLDVLLMLAGPDSGLSGLMEVTEWTGLLPLLVVEGSNDRLVPFLARHVPEMLERVRGGHRYQLTELKRLFDWECTLKAWNVPFGKELTEVADLHR